MRSVVLALLLLGFVACAPRTQANYELLSTPADDSSFQLLIAPFYRDLATSGVEVGAYEVFAYYGDDRRVPKHLETELVTQNEGFCLTRPAAYRANNDNAVLVLSGDGQGEVRGLVYDRSRAPRLTYATFEGQSFLPLARRC